MPASNELGISVYMVLPLELGIQKKGVIVSPSITKEITEVSCVSGVSLHGGPTRPLCKVVNVKPVEDTRITA